MVAAIDMVQHLQAYGGQFKDLEDLLKTYQQVREGQSGQKLNTLVVQAGDKSISLRRFYDVAENFFRSEQKRNDYPNAAPHATQSWVDYRHWFSSLLGVPEAEALKLRQRVVEFVLAELPSHAIDPSTIKPLPRPFTELLEHFPIEAQEGEKHGAVFQGIVFAYIRADAPHLVVEINKVGAGSKRLHRVGDIDGWQGERLVTSAEVKSFNVDQEQAAKTEPFCGAVIERKALGLVAALSFTDEARAYYAERGIGTLDLSDLRRLVALWDPLKQQAALDAFVYCVNHVEQNSALMSRLQAFTAQMKAKAEAGE